MSTAATVDTRLLAANLQRYSLTPVQPTRCAPCESGQSRPKRHDEQGARSQPNRLDALVRPDARFYHWPATFDEICAAPSRRQSPRRTYPLWAKVQPRYCLFPATETFVGVRANPDWGHTHQAEHN